jgi:hypothetical protein
LCEAHTFSGHLIEVRRGNGFASVTAEVGDANVIGDDEYNVGFLIAHGISDIIVCLPAPSSQEEKLVFDSIQSR